MKNNGIPKLERLVGARLLGGFQKFARTVVRTSGHPMAFAIAIGTIVIWALTGPWVRFGNTWLLVRSKLSFGPYRLVGIAEMKLHPYWMR